MNRRRPAVLATLCAASAVAALAVLPVVPAGAVGPTWSVVSTTAPTVIAERGVACPSVTVCYGLARTEGGISLIRATSDGGTTWTDAAAFPISLVPSGIACVSVTECVAIDAASEVLRTTDGWTTWTKVPLAGGVSLTSLVCAPSGACAARAVGQNDGDLFLFSANGGATWAAHGIAGDRDAEVSGGFETTSLACAVATTCVTTGQTLVRRGTHRVAVLVLFRTDDGGRRWREVALPRGTDDVESLACPTATRCLAVGSSGHDAVALESQSAGASWRTVLRWATILELAAISCPTGSVCVAAGLARAGLSVARTTSGGRTWSRHAVSPLRRFQGPTAIACPSTQRCTISLAGLPETFEGTVDGATTWTSEDTAVLAPVLDDVSCPVADTCEAVGDALGVGGAERGFVERTTDDGTTWQAQTLPSGVAVVYDVVCPTVSTCFAAGFGTSFAHAVLLVTTDEGSTWRTLTAPAVVYVDPLSCPSVTVCVGVGETDKGPEFLRTTDGGSTWTTPALPGAPSGVTYEVHDVTCTSTSDCLASGEADFNDGFSSVATFFASTDGRSTWTAVSLPGQGQFDSTDLPAELSCSSATTCVALAYSDGFVNTPGGGQFAQTLDVYETTDSGAAWAEEHSIGAQIAYVGGIACSAGGACQMVGEDPGTASSYAIASTDGGLTWSSTPMPATWAASNELSCATATSCVSVGVTTDGGFGVAAYG